MNSDHWLYFFPCAADSSSTHSVGLFIYGFDLLGRWLCTKGGCGRGGFSDCWAEHHLDSWCLYSRHESISFLNSMGLVQDTNLLLCHIGLWLRCDNESCMRLCHYLTWVNLCLGASLSSHLAPLIVVCLEGDWRWKWSSAQRSNYWPVTGLRK